MNRILLGVVGHVDHGKTTLVRALTGMDTDRLPEEKRRGISIALGFAHLQIGDTIVDLIDMPGHERFVRTMVSGAVGVQAILLVIAANEGAKPQTREHVDVASLLGVNRAIAVVTKADLVSPDQAKAVADDASALLAASGIQAAAPVLVSLPNHARADQGVDPALGRLRAAIAELAGASEPPSNDGFPYLPIDRAFTLPGFGLVVTGTLRRGLLSPGCDLVVAPSETPVRVRGLQVHGVAVDRVHPGQRVAVNLRTSEPDRIGRGVALTRPDLLAGSSWLSVALRSLADAPSLRGGGRLTLLIGTAEAQVRLRLLDRDELAPGAAAVAQLQCDQALCVPARERFILRTLSPPLTVAGGRVLEPDAVRRRRGDPAVLDRLRALEDADAPQLISGELHRAGRAGATLVGLARLAGLAPERLDHTLTQLDAVRAGKGVMSRSAFDGLCADVLRRLGDELERQPNGMAVTRLAPLAPVAAPQLLDTALSRLIERGKIRRQGPAVRLMASHGEEQARLRQETMILADLAERFRQAGLTPPDPASVAAHPAARRALERLVREGVVVKTFDRVQGREVLFHHEAINMARNRLAPLLAPPGLSVKDAGAALGVSRKFSIPLLEHLDGQRFTRRMGDRRVLGGSGQRC